MKRNHLFTTYIADETTSVQMAIDLLNKIDLDYKKLRFLGITLSNFLLDTKFKEKQLRLF